MELRRYLDEMKKLGRLIEIEEEVDWNLEAHAFVHMMSRVAVERGYGLLFSNIKGYKGKGRLAGFLYGGSFRRYWEGPAILLGLPPDISWEDLRAELLRRTQNPIKPIEVAASEAPCKGIVKIGAEANLFDFPIPYCHAGDGGRYLTNHGFINQDPDTGWINCGLYRFMAKAPRRAGMLFELGQQGPTIYYQKYDIRGETMPFCLVIGTDSTEMLIYSMAAAAGICEYDLIGGLRNEPLELVRAETNNLLVPARCEVVIEGEVPPRERTDEGPFVEYSGFAHGRHLSPVFDIAAITQRENPILPFTVMGALSNDDSAIAMRLADCAAAIPYIQGLGFKPEEMEDLLFVAEAPEAFIQMKGSPESPQTLQEIMQAMYTFKNSIYWFQFAYHDPDVDLMNSLDCIESLGANFDPRTFKLHETDMDSLMNPLCFFTDAENRFKGTDAAKIGFDCTTKFKDPQYVWRKDRFDQAYPLEVRERVKKNWDKWGFDREFIEKGW